MEELFIESRVESTCAEEVTAEELAMPDPSGEVTVEIVDKGEDS
jgi:hypothetical protein